MSDAITWALIVIAVLAVQAAEGPLGSEERRREGEGGATLGSTLAEPFATPAAIARTIIAGGAGLAVVVGLLDFAGAGGTTSSGVDRNQQVVSGALQVAAGGLSLLLFYAGTDRIPGLRRLRPGAPISWLAIFLLLESLASNVGIVSGTGSSPGPSSHTVGPVGPGPTARDLMLGEVPFLAIALASVGVVVRRSAVQALERLGLWPLRVPWWVVGVGVGIVLVPVGSWVVELLDHFATASCVASTAQAEQAIVGVGRTTLEQVGIAIAAGVCEEALFRGALQPRVGIVLSSVVWASYHLQYMCNGWPSPANLYLVLLGLLFGVLRKWGGLSSAILAHTVYDGAILLHFLGA